MRGMSRVLGESLARDGALAARANEGRGARPITWFAGAALHRDLSPSPQARKACRRRVSPEPRSCSPCSQVLHYPGPAELNHLVTLSFFFECSLNELTPLLNLVLS